jgi:signal transduction histidine kinase
MPAIWQELRTRLRYHIILPFLILTLFVALVGYAIIFFVLANSSQETFDNQLAESTRIAKHSLLDQEKTNLQFLIEVVFAPANPTTDAPAVSEALKESLQPGAVEGLRLALNPYFRRGLTRSVVNMDRMIAFDRRGYSLADFEHVPYTIEGMAEDAVPTTVITDTRYVTNTVLDVTSIRFVPDILSGAVETFENSDLVRDKYAGFVTLPSATGGDKNYFATVAPVKVSDDVVGGIIVAMDIDNLSQTLQTNANADIITFYDTSGTAWVSSKVPDEGLAELNIGDDLVPRIQNLVEQDVDHEAIMDVRTINGEEYQFSYSRLTIRGEPVGILGAALSRADMNSWAMIRIPLIGVTIASMLGIIGIGFVMARRITHPLDELVATARAVTHGDFSRRSQVTAEHEIGMLASAFNQMTEYLTQLIRKVQAQSGERQAIVESITDGIIVCNNEGEVQLVNRAMYTLLGLELDDRERLPGRFSDLPLVLLTESVFGATTNDLYMLGNYIVRVSVAPVITAQGHCLGNVYVLQDMTAEVNMDRAKTNFIATISHEMRTPLTSLRGNSDMLMHGLAGPINDEQKQMLETMSQQTNNMTRLINNMIVIAGLESGSLKVEPEPVSLKRVIEESLWPMRKALKAKKLTLNIDLPTDIEVNADRIQLRTVMQQLIDNARVYTDEGSITVQAVREIAHVRVDVIDTGCGIDPELLDKVFERFVRGEGSNDRPDRGIGLGLAIVQQLIELHHGQVWVSSTLGEGSMFSFTLPYAPTVEEPDQEAVSEAA